MRQPHPPPRTSGFTLTEMVVAIAVVIALIALLVPSYVRATTAGFDAAARNCAVEIGKAASVYMAGHNGTLPTAPFNPNVLGGNVQEACADIRVMPYASPTARSGTEYAVYSWHDRGPAFFTSHPRGSGFFPFNRYDSYCGANGCVGTTYLGYEVYGL